MDEHVASTLAAKRAELETELTDLSATQGDAGGISFGKRVGEGTSLAVERLTNVAAYDKLAGVLDEVRHAQERLASGTYGACEVCGRPIAAERLEARPWAATCASCAGRR